MRKMLIAGIIAVVVIAVAVFAAVMVSKSKKLDAYMETLQINEVDVSAVSDGVYAAEVDAGMIRVALEVTVKDHKIMKIDLLQHQNGQGDAANAVTGTIVQEQRIGVDVVSGATLSSRVIQKAVENALTGGVRKEE